MVAGAKEIPEDLIAEMKAALHYCPATGYFTWTIQSGWQIAHVAIGKRAGSVVSGTGYWDVTWKGVAHKAHRLAWAFMYGPPDPKKVIDHINGDRLDNRIANLRLVSGSQNGLNQKALSSRTASGCSGVYWSPKDRRWFAKIVVDKKQIHLGNHRTLEEAIAARIAGRKRYCPEAAR